MKRVRIFLIAIKNCLFSTKAILIVIAFGIWGLVLQNLGVIPIATPTKRVVIEGGSVHIKGSVRINNEVDVNVRNNVLDINLQEINGQRNVFFNNPARGESYRYYRIPVTIN